jgi:tRNA (mo5U34)-methyltransferase
MERCTLWTGRGFRETTMDRAETQKRISEIRWYHEFDFGDGLRTVPAAPPAAGHRLLWRFIEAQLAAIDFSGKTVLDIGCWDGYWSFEAEKRGAAAVLAVDDFTQNPSDSRGIYLAKELLASKIDVLPDRSVYDLASLDRRFDIILCLGVYYHLWDPFYAFAQIRHCCRQGTVVVLEGNMTTALPQKALYFTASLPLSRFTPTREALSEMLTATYLRPTGISGIIPLPTAEDPASWGRLPPDCNIRVVVTCEPIDGPNELHIYKPPFGLHAYDPRFRATSA